jgi:hypothetical protein
MGFNFSGVAISQKTKEDFVEIQEILGVKLTFSEEIGLDTAMSWHNKKDSEFDFYFCEKGVLIFMNVPFISAQNAKSKGIMLTTFAASEMTMYFMVSASKHGEQYRELSEHEGTRKRNDGQKFNEETETDDGFDIVLNAISHTIGQSFWSLDHEKTAYRYIRS